MFTFPIGMFGGSVVKPSLMHVDEKSNAGAALTYNFTDVNFGDNSTSTRIIVVCAFGRKAAGLSAGTIGGVSANIDLSQNQLDYCMGIMSAVVDSGNSGSVSVTFNDSADAANISVFAIDGMQSTSVNNTYNNTSTTTQNIACNSNAAVIAMAGNYINGGGTMTWSGIAGVTEATDSTADSVMMTSTASLLTSTTLSNNSVRATLSGVANRDGIAIAIWE